MLAEIHAQQEFFIGFGALHAVDQQLHCVHRIHVIQDSAKNPDAAKFLFILSFIIPVLLLDLPKAVVVAAIWGLSALALVSFIIARGREKVWKSIAEHLIVALLVIALTHYTGEWISATFC